MTKPQTSYSMFPGWRGYLVDHMPMTSLKQICSITSGVPYRAIFTQTPGLAANDGCVGPKSISLNFNGCWQRPTTITLSGLNNFSGVQVGKGCGQLIIDPSSFLGQLGRWVVRSPAPWVMQAIASCNPSGVES